LTKRFFLFGYLEACRSFFVVGVVPFPELLSSFFTVPRIDQKILENQLCLLALLLGHILFDEGIGERRIGLQIQLVD
jgi:hypothetical protein